MQRIKDVISKIYTTMNLLITGIHGFVGSNLVSALKAGHSIYGLDIVAPEKDGIVKIFSWDDLDKLPEMDTIIHLAGKAHNKKNKYDATNYSNNKIMNEQCNVVDQ
ncbi:hypothetical protein FACS1894177_03170 [Bacteroidia bacterium]|nr:hypothetical protein FACS1894177_03170 [Bacteroidia bacterium]